MQLHKLVYVKMSCVCILLDDVVSEIKLSIKSTDQVVAACILKEWM